MDDSLSSALVQQQTEKFSKVIAPAAAVAAIGEIYKLFFSIYLCLNYLSSK